MMLSINLYLYRYKKSETELPVFLSGIQCGFPSPADDYLEEVISLDDVCNTHPSSTFLGRAAGNSLNDVGIFEGDILVIDKSIKPQDGDLVICAIDGEFNAKILRKDSTCFMLLSANPKFKPIIIKEFQDFRIWGVITYVIQNIKYRSSVWNV